MKNPRLFIMCFVKPAQVALYLILLVIMLLINLPLVRYVSLCRNNNSDFILMRAEVSFIYFFQIQNYSFLQCAASVVVNNLNLFLNIFSGHNSTEQRKKSVTEI